jgi:hypothetical protein
MAYRKPISPPDSTCSNVVDCAVTNPDPVALAMLVAAALAFLLLLTVAVSHVTEARSLLDEERTRIADEAEAFATFARRVADVETATTPVTDGGGTATTALGTAPPDDRLERVRDAYRDTVMAVPHYDAEYGESLPRNMGLEFGEDVAVAVEEGGDLTPQLQATLVERSRTARRQRTALLGQLETEAEALDDAEATLERCRRTAERLGDDPLDGYSYDELLAEWRLLEDRKDDADALLTERQQTLQERDRSTASHHDGPTFEQYLYGPMEPTHPVLAAGTSVVDRLDAAGRRVLRVLASRT